MHDLGFIIAGYGVILGGVTLYAALLLRRLAAARRASLQVRRDAEPPGPLAPDREA
ncbi:MAG TPA: hypothetical protein VFH98_07595 [Candidatus Limnocylindria bacterium]|nr:hypothetical protein [Candidatus Limnocylindria bacterium]